MSRQSKGTRETKAEFNIWYGAWLRDCRKSMGKSIEEVAAITGVPVNVLRDMEAGRYIELYDVTPLWEYYGIESGSEE